MALFLDKDDRDSYLIVKMCFDVLALGLWSFRNQTAPFFSHFPGAKGMLHFQFFSMSHEKATCYVDATNY